MVTGPGKYNDACTAARLATGADTVLLIVLGGNQGQGFSLQTVDPGVAARLPALLRMVADDIERDMA